MLGVDLMTEKEGQWVYILTCGDNSMYVGMTKDIVKRYFQHITKTAKCKYTRRKDKHPLKLSVCWKIFGTRGDAIKVEMFIKKGQKNLKNILVKDPDSLTKMFYESTNHNLNISNFEDIQGIEEKVQKMLS